MPGPPAGDVAGLPLDQLEAMILDQAGQVNAAYSGVPVGGAAPPAPPMQAPMQAPMLPTPGDLAMGISPDLVMAATAALTGAGLLPQATDTLTPEIVAALQAAADAQAPGLYDLANNPQDLHEFLVGVANGTINPAPPAPRGHSVPVFGPGGPAPGGLGGGPVGPGGPAGPVGPGAPGGLGF